MTRLTVHDVALRWHCHHETVRLECVSGNLRAMKIGNRWLIDPADVDAYEAARKNKPPVDQSRRRRRTVAVVK